MDNLLQGLGSSSRYPEGGQHSAPGNLQEECESLKSKILSKRPEAKVRPSSYSCEEERCVPPQPPMRKDSFRATRSQSGVADKRCVSAPVGIPSLDSCMVEDQPPVHLQTGNVYLNGKQDNEQGSRLEPYYTFSQKESGRDNSRESEKKHSEDQSKSVQSNSLERNVDEHFDTQLQPDMHRHSAPEKLLTSQLRTMNLSTDKSDRSTSPTCQWSQSPLYLNEIGPDMAQAKWEASRCSTPGSLATSEPEDPRLDEETLSCGQNVWAQSVCVDTRPDESSRGEPRADDGEVTKQSSRRQFRNSKSRRRSERFATNLRNEIQRKKAQLQKSRNSGCGDETVEEEVTDLNTEAVVPLENNQQRTQTFTSPEPPTASVHTSKPTPQQVPVSTHAEEHSRTRPVSYQTSETQNQISEHNRQECVHVVEELAPAGKPRRWRWTPERKLQPETPPANQQPIESKNKEATGQMWSGKTGTLRGRTSSSSGRLGRSDESDIPPFADRRRFFEETSRKLSQSVTNLSGLTSRNQRPDKPRHNRPSSPEPLETGPPNLGRRRFSYQGVVQDGPYINSLDTGGQFMRVQNNQDVMREVIEREKKVREKEKEREQEKERIKEQEKLQEQAREMERLSREREKERQRLQEWEERQRQLKREKEWESERETVQSEHSISSNTVSHSSSRDVYRKQPSGPQVPSSHQLSEHYYSNTATNVQKHCSAFQPVIGQHNPYDGYHGNPAYKTRSYTPTEVRLGIKHSFSNPGLLLLSTQLKKL